LTAVTVRNLRLILYIYIDRQTDGRTDRQADRQIDRQDR